MVVQLLRNDNVFVANSMSELSEERGELVACCRSRRRGATRNHLLLKDLLGP